MIEARSVVVPGVYDCAWDNVLRVFIGYDPRQPLAYQVLAHSLTNRASKPVAVTKLKLSQLPITRAGLTEFTYSRFLVPWLCGYQGHAIFIDSDFLCLGDVVDLMASAFLDEQVNGPAGVYVVKGPHRFEWASMMVFNNEQCRSLTPEYVQDPKNHLLDLAWAERIGTLPADWNHLVNYDQPNPNAKLIHFTCGIPCWPETKHHEFSAEWHHEAKASMATVSFKELMGRSVHVTRVAEVNQRLPSTQPQPA